MTQKLGANYVLWGGREGYETLLNTDMKRELDQLGRFMHLVAEHRSTRSGSRGRCSSSPSRASPPSTSTTTTRRRCTPSSSATACRPTTSGSTSGQPRHARRPQFRARGRLRPRERRVRQHRHEPRWRSPARWDTDQFGNDIAELTGGRAHRRGRWVLHRRLQLRRQGPPPEQRRRGPVPRPRRRHGQHRPRPCSSRTRCSPTASCRASSTSATRAGRRASAATSLAGKATLEQLSERAGAKLDPKPRSGRREMLENLVNR